MYADARAYTTPRDAQYAIAAPGVRGGQDMRRALPREGSSVVGWSQSAADARFNVCDKERRAFIAWCSNTEIFSFIAVEYSLILLGDDFRTRRLGFRRTLDGFSNHD